jgi:hypothetical protein
MSKMFEFRTGGRNMTSGVGPRKRISNGLAAINQFAIDSPRELRSLNKSVKRPAAAGPTRTTHAVFK